MLLAARSGFSVIILSASSALDAGWANDGTLTRRRDAAANAEEIVSRKAVVHLVMMFSHVFRDRCRSGEEMGDPFFGIHE